MIRLTLPHYFRFLDYYSVSRFHQLSLYNVCKNVFFFISEETILKSFCIIQKRSHTQSTFFTKRIFQGSLKVYKSFIHQHWMCQQIVMLDSTLDQVLLLHPHLQTLLVEINTPDLPYKNHFFIALKSILSFWNDVS